MSYYLLLWRQDSPKFPVLIASEVDESQTEVRKVEIFPDGSVGFADEYREVGGTGLAEVPYPPPDNSNFTDELHIVQVDGRVFSALWNLAVKRNE